MLELAFQPDRASREPLYRQLADYLRGMVAAGRLVAGEKLPATRELADLLALSRNTVNQAYGMLVDAGVLTAHVGQGTFVASREAAAGAGGSGASRAAPRGFAWEGLVSRRAKAVAPPAALRRATPDPVRFDFRGGRVPDAALPAGDLRRAYGRALAQELPRIANQIDPFGWPPLREAIARHLVARGIGCEAGDVAVVSGAQQALEFVARVLLDPGDVAVMEQPGYFGAALCFRAAQAETLGVDVDEDGLRVDQLARIVRSRRVKLVCTTPAAQSPTGVVLSDARRRALLELADEYQIPIVEDDYDSEFRYGNPPRPALKTLDAAGQVIYVGTFSKALFPGLRLGYVVAPRPLLARLVWARWASDFGSDAVAQAAVTELLVSGALERHVRRVRRAHAARRDAMLAALDAHMPEGVRWTRPFGGHAVWVVLPGRADADAVFADAVEEGIAYARGDLAYLDGRGLDCLHLAFVNEEPERIEAGIARLGEIVRRHAVWRRSA